MSAIVPQHIFVYDTAQTIEHYEGGRSRADRAVFREGDICPWEHHVCPMTLGPLDIALKDKDVFRLTWSWRLGSAMCEFLRETTPCYSTRGSTELQSASDHKHLLSEKEKQRAPKTVLQFVMLQGAGCSVVSGGRAKHGVRIDSRENRNKGKESSRAFACEEIFYLALLEGLYILGQALKGNFRPRTESRRDLPAQPQPGEIVIETILYLNAARRTFLELVQAALQHPTIRQHFGICATNPGEHWHVKTPEGSSGDTAWWLQLLVIPRVADGADVAGNMKSSGRRVVAQSRGTYGNTNYLVRECFSQGKGDRHPLDTWKLQCKTLASDSCPYTRAEVPNWRTDKFSSPRSLPSFPARTEERRRALEMLFKEVPLATAVAGAMKTSEETKGKALPEAIETLLVRIASQATVGDAGTQQPEESPPTSRRRIGDGDFFSVRWRSPLEAKKALGIHGPGECGILKKQLVPWPTITIRGGYVQVCILVLGTSAGPGGKSPSHILEHVVRTGQEIALNMWRHYELGIAEAMLVPHKLKRHIVNDTCVTLRQCWSERRALVLVPTHKPDPNTPALYTYIGGGVDHQPPNTYPLVFKSMPLAIGACLVATASALMGIEITMPMIYCRDMSQSDAERTVAEARFLESVQEQRKLAFGMSEGTMRINEVGHSVSRSGLSDH